MVPPVGGANERVRGRLVAAAGGRVTGWAWDSQTNERVEIGVLVDGEQTGVGRSEIFRDGLRRAGVGDGAHAFAINLPERLRDGAHHTVGAVALADGSVIAVASDFIGESPAGHPWFGTIFTPDRGLSRTPPAVETSQAAGPLGLLETITDGHAFGWAYDPLSPWRRLELEVLVDGELVAETVADLPRPSLAQEGIGDGRHGFVVELPDRLCDNAAHIISVCLSTGEALPLARLFQVTVTSAEEWGGTTFTGPGEDTPSRSAPRQPSSEHESGGPPATGTGTATLTRARRVLHLRASDDLVLPRRALREGFSERSGRETVVMGSEMVVEVAEQLLFAVQPGVSAPLAERSLRFATSADYSVPRLLASRLPGAIVDTRAFVIMPDERRYLVESVRHRATLARWGYELSEDSDVEYEVEEISERDERVVVLGAQSNVNYSHWLVESVARALLFRPLDDGSWLYLTPPLAGWQREMLELAGVGGERILELEPQGLVRFAEVVSVSRGMGGLPALRPACVAALAELAAPTGERRRIYCSRALTRYRHVTNEAEMEELLSRHGFESVCPETLSVKEQIETFAAAEAVFALHGSGLTNILFSRPGTLVIELQAEGFNRGGVVWNWILASMREQPFAQIVCPLDDARPDLAHAHRDVTVDIPHLDSVLSRLLPT